MSARGLERRQFRFLLLLAALAWPAPSALGAAAKFLGPNKCTSCHDHEKQAAWVGKDTHAKALEQLEDKNAAKYAKAIGLADAYDLKGSCVGCHATVFNGDANAGVSCETCHGAGSEYVEPHQQKGSYEKAVALGMFDTRGNLQVWAKMCVDCHVMRDAKLIASGHKSGADFDTGTGSQKIVHWVPAYDFAKLSALGKAGGGKPAAGGAAAPKPEAKPAPPAPAAAPTAPPPAKPTAAPAAPAAPAPTSKPVPPAAEPPPAAAKPAPQPSPVPEVKKPTSPPAPAAPTAAPPPAPTAAVPAAPAPAAPAAATTPSPTPEIPITIEATPVPTRSRPSEAPPPPRAAEPPAASVAPAAPAAAAAPPSAAPAEKVARPTPRRAYPRKTVPHVTPQPAPPAPTVTPTKRPAPQAPPVRAPH